MDAASAEERRAATALSLGDLEELIMAGDRRPTLALPNPALALALCHCLYTDAPLSRRAADHTDWDTKDWQWDPVSLTAVPRQSAAAQISRYVSFPH